MPEMEMWMLAATVAVAVVPWAFSMHAKVAVIAHSVESLPEIVAELRDCIAEHEARLQEHDAEIKTLKIKTGTGG